MAAFSFINIYRVIIQGLKLLFQVPEWFALISKRSLLDDAYAGLTGATIVLPQAIAFAAIAGLPPEYGFYTAIITPVVAALTGSSLHTVSGPTTAISALVFATLAGSFTPGSAEFIEAAITLTFLVGVFQMILGFARLGGLVDFVSHSVMTGFILGAAVLIGLSQIRHAIGVDLPRPEHLTEFVTQFWDQVQNANPVSILVALTSLLTGYLIKKYFPKHPNYIIALAAGTAVYFACGGTELDVKTVGIIPSVIPMFETPHVNVASIQELSSAALAIAFVGLLEAMSISRAIAIKSKQELNTNKEFKGQGFSNLVGSFFHCYPGSASFTRSGINYDAGAKTPISAIFAAIFLVLIMYFVAPYFAYVPIPAMAGVIILVAWKLVDIPEIIHIFKTSQTETWIALVTFLSSLAINLEFSIYAGVFLSLALFLNKTAHPYIGVAAPDPSTEGRVFKNAASNSLTECPQLMVARIDGPLYFGSVEFLRKQFRRFEVERPDQVHMILIVKGVGEIDLPGAELLIEEAQKRKIRGGSFHLQTATPSTIKKLTRFHVSEYLGTEHVYLSKGEAIAEVIPMMDQSICAECPVQIFRECPRFKERQAELAAERAQKEMTPA